jgi:hypothetical protein
MEFHDNLDAEQQILDRSRGNIIETLRVLKRFDADECTPT